MNTTAPQEHPKLSRRRFLQIGCLSTAAVGMTLCGITAAAPDPPPVVLSSTTFGEESMSKRVLIAYATFTGSTQEAAIEIGKTLGERGFAVDVSPVLEKPQVDAYDYVLIGSAVHGSKWLAEALEFVEANRDALNRVPVALFSLCLAGMSRDEAQLSSARDKFYAPVRAFVTPVAEVLFAGRIDRRGVARGLPGWLARFFPTMDFRNWDKIRSWAQALSIPKEVLGI
ncbi:MAG: flavodoxin domain-containing protein [Anaerolineae bacterium]|nr:flavodoxin domain-containing protein [Anaerolineae bacterium]